MRTPKVILIALGLLILAAGAAEAGDPGGPVVLTFEPTAMLAPAPDPLLQWPSTSVWPPNGNTPSINGLGATGWMNINPGKGQTTIDFFLRGARPNTLYTIWTVFRPLLWCTNPVMASLGCPDTWAPGTPQNPINPPAGKVTPNVLPSVTWAPMNSPFYPDGSPVAPTASLSSAFTSGMGPDTGATFWTNVHGDGEVHVTLDYNLLGTTYDDGAPVSNSTNVQQCAATQGPNKTLAPGPQLTYTAANCKSVTMVINGQDFTTTPKFTVTSSWLRKYISQVKDPVTDCANYNPADPTSIFWQCIDPATVNRGNGPGLPRVWRFAFDHFRLAAHPDLLTHGFIGGSNYEHAIDMVGRRCKIQPAYDLPPC